MKTILSTLALLICTGLASADITVTGTGKIPYVPDTGYITVGVVGEGKTAADAWQKNREIVERLFAVLQKNGVALKDLQTTGLNVSPKYFYPKNEEPRLLGYTVSYDLKVTVRKLDDLSRILDELVLNGANRSMNIAFSSSEAEKLLDQARMKAVSEARRKAKLYANGAGANLGQVVSISDQSVAPLYRLQYEHVPASATKGLPIASGEQEMTVTVTVTYSLLPLALPEGGK